MDETLNVRRNILMLFCRNTALRRLLAALAVSQLGDWLYNLALLALVYDRTHSVAWTAATTCARVLPMVLLGPFGGVLADRYDRRRLMIASDVARVGAMVLLAAVAAAGLPVILAPALAAASTAFSVVYPPCVAATVPRVVSDVDLPAATAARSAIGAAAIIAGPAGGALLLLLNSPAWAFLLNAATFAASALLLVRLAPGARFAPPPKDECHTAGVGVLADLRASLAVLRADTVVARIIGADVVCSLAYGAHTVLLLLLSRTLGGGDSGYGWLLAGIGVGGVVGAAVAGRLRIQDPRRLIGGMLLVAAVPSVLLAVTPSVAVGVVLAALVGAGAVMVEVVVDTSLARRLDEAILGRAYGLAYPAAIAGIALGSLITAPLVRWLGVSGALAAVGAVVAAYASWIGISEVGRRPARSARLDSLAPVGTE
jgi:Arabinose efflux permease